MKKFIFLEYVSGAAGNFLTRCLNLLDNAYCWDNSTTALSYSHTLEEKLKFLGYQSVMNLKVDERNWVEWESELRDYTVFRKHHDIPNNSIAVLWAHPDLQKDKFNNCYEKFCGPEDKGFRFYIDPTNNLEWCMMNAHYKDSYISVDWHKEIEAGKKLLINPDVHKVDLKKIVDGYDSFFSEFCRICSIIDHHLQNEEIEAIKILYNNWKLTILDYKDFRAYKIKIGGNVGDNVGKKILPKPIAQSK